MYALGGSIYHYGAYRVHVFTGNSTFIVTEAGNVEVMIVGGGGGGYQTGGGGGAIVHHTSFATTPQSYNVVIGGGGAGSSSNGGNSSFGGMTANGGGLGGANNNAVGSNGGCGGGAGRDYGSPGSSNQGAVAGATIYGNRGGYASGTGWGGGGGGGGAGAVGGQGYGNGNQNAEIGGDGGSGLYTTIRGYGEYLAGGGGAGTGSTSSVRAGYAGAGGGGAGNMTGTGGAGTANTGGGGGGGLNASGGAGGSGIVIIRYLIPTPKLAKATSNLTKRRVLRNPKVIDLPKKRRFNLAYLKRAVGSDGIATSIITDNNFDTASYFGISGSSYVQIDLQDIYMVDQINMWHYYGDLRIYNYNTLQISLDGTNWTTVFDSEVNGRYIETVNGKTVRFDPRQIRYVRNSMNGSNMNAGSHWCELQVMGYAK